MLDFARADRGGVCQCNDGVSMELFLAADDAHFRDLAQKHAWCAAADLDRRFYAYLAQDAFRSPLYTDLLKYHVANGLTIESTNARYTFRSRYNEDDAWSRTFGPGRLPPSARRMLALVENSSRGIVTEVPDGICDWWPKAARMLAQNDILLLTAATPATVERLWCPQGGLPIDFPNSPALPMAVLYNGGYYLLTLEALRDTVEWQPYRFGLDPRPLRDLLDGYLKKHRPPMPGRTHSTLPDCQTVTELQDAGWTLLNRMAPLPVEPDDCDLFREKYPALLLLRQSPDGNWTAEETCPWRMPTFDEMLTAFYSEYQGKTYGLAVDRSLPLTRPEDVLRGTIYAFCSDSGTKTMELTDGTAALQRFRDALNPYIEKNREKIL